MAEGGSSNKNFGSGDNRWRGQIVDDSVWRDNILAGKYEDKDSVPGYGRRYKVRIFGEHDLGGEEGYPIPDEQLPWAHIEYPVTAGSGAGNCKQTPALRQGNIVSGYWSDGANKQVPIITGVIGNNEQTILGTKFPVPVTESGTSLAVSAFPNKQLKLPDLVCRPKPPQTALITKKPTLQSIAQEIASVVPNTPLDDLGLPLGRGRTPSILADIQKAAELADARGDLNPEQILELSKYIVQRGIKERKRQANSPFSGASPGATTEALGEHLKTAVDIGRENKLIEKIILASPDDPVDSATKAIQTISDNLTQKIKLYTNSLTDYAAATQRPGDDFSKMIKDSAGQISKYMKVIMQKVHEYTNKKMNAELTDVVAEMPCYMRAQFLDVKELNNENLLKSFNGITDGMSGLIENILSTSLDVDSLVAGVNARASSSDPLSVGLGLLDSFASAQGNNTGESIQGNNFSPGANDSTIDLSNIPQAYNTTTTYVPGNSVIFDGITYVNKLTATDKFPSDTLYWTPITGARGGSNDEIVEYQNEQSNTYTKVPICYAEDIVGQVFSYNKTSINGAVEKAVRGMNKYVEDMQSQLNSYDQEFKYQAGKGSTKEVLALSDEEGLGDVRGGTGYTTQVSVGTTYRGSVGNTVDQATGGGLTVDIVVSRGGPVGKTSPGFTDAAFDALGNGDALTWDPATTEDGYWITFIDGGTGWQKTVGSNPGTTFTTGTLIGCPCSVVGSSGQGATADVHFTAGVVDAIRVNENNYWDGTNSYKIGDELTISATGINNASGSGAQFRINEKMVENVAGRLRGPIDDRKITIANGGRNYQVGQLVNVDQGPNPYPASGNPADAIGAPAGGAAGGKTNASVSVVSTFDKGDIVIGKDEGAEDDSGDGGGGGFANMLSGLGGVLGNLTSALSFDNMPSNVFPFELPPNKALADYYTLGDGGAAAPDSEIPMMGQIAKMAEKATSAIPSSDIPFALPINPQDINLKVGLTAKDAQTALNNTVAGWKNASSNLMNT